MIVKGIVEKIISNNQIKVRIPSINKIAEASGSTPTDELSDASLCVFPGTKLNINIGSVVYVGFIDDNWDLPIILGTPQIDTIIGNQDTTLNNLSVSNTTKLPKDTYIGDVSNDALSKLKGLKYDLNETIDGIISNIEQISSESLPNIYSQIKDINSRLDLYNTNFKEFKLDTNQAIDDLGNRVTELEHKPQFN